MPNVPEEADSSPSKDGPTKRAAHEQSDSLATVRLPPEIEEALAKLGLGEGKPESLIAISKIAAHFYKGPIPPAEMLLEYERIQPGLAAEIVKWTRTQQAHRRELEKLTTEGAERRMERAQFMAAGIAALSVVASALVAVWGSPFAAAVIAVVGVGGPSAATVIARAVDKWAER